MSDLFHSQEPPLEHQQPFQSFPIQSEQPSQLSDQLPPPQSFFPSGSSSSDDSFLVPAPLPVPTFQSFDDSSSSSDDYLSPSPRRKPRRIVGSKTSFLLGPKLGDGSYATVKEAIDENTLRIVAVKILDTRRLRRLKGGLGSIEQEISIHRSIKHPNVIALIDVIRNPQKNRLYIILEMANGCSLHQLAALTVENVLPQPQLQNYVYQALIGLQFLHGRGVVHRDIKPANMLITHAHTIKLADFGVAELLNGYLSDDNVSKTSGSPAFQSPEIVRGELNYSGSKADVWALGVTIYLLLTGKVPFWSDSILGMYKIIQEGVYEVPHHLGESVVDLLDKMLCLDPAERAGVDDLLKHPWVVSGETSDATDRKDWQQVPKREFGVMKVVSDMYGGEQSGHPPPHNSTQSLPEVQVDRLGVGMRSCCIA